MAQVINTNITSLNSQRHLNNTNSALSRAMERLSSGKRINSAKDDAAGLGISARMTTQVNGMNQAIRNANDGISLSQTAEGALSTSEEMLQRIRTLAVQASNATNASIDRQAMQDEVNQLTAELNRIAQTTTFNGQKILDGTMGVQNYQVGANAGEIITATGTNFQTNVYGNNRIEGNAALVKRSDAADAFGAAPATAYTYAALTISGSLGSKTTTTASTTAKALAAEVNSLTSETGVTATAKTEALLTITTNGAFSVKLASDNADTDALTVSYTINKTDSADDFAAAINAFNAVSSKTGVTAEYDQVNKGIKLVNASGNDIKLANDLVAATGNGAQKLNTYKADGSANATALELSAKSGAGKLTTAYAKGVVTFDSEKSFSVSGTTDANQAFSIIDGQAAETANAVGASTLHSVAELDVTSFDKAQLALEICDAAINIINSERAKYGALQSRFESTIKNLEVNSENTSNARSRIQDADYASETAELSRASILQQAGTAMLAQANQLPQTVLSLIG